MFVYVGMITRLCALGCDWSIVNDDDKTAYTVLDDDENHDDRLRELHVVIDRYMKAVCNALPPSFNTVTVMVTVTGGAAAAAVAPTVTTSDGDDGDDGDGGGNSVASIICAYIHQPTESYDDGNGDDVDASDDERE